MSTILVCGSRDWRNDGPIKAALSECQWTDTIIHGGAQGADSIAARIANELHLEVVAFRADWKTHGRAAGPIRNRQMLREGKPDMVIAFRLDGPSPGTDDMIRQAKAAGVPVRVVRP